MKIGIPREVVTGETRVAATPVTIPQLIKLGYEVIVEKNAGLKSNFSNQAYEEAGATIVHSNDIWQSDIVLKVNSPSEEEIKKIKKESILVSFFAPATYPDKLNLLNEKNVTVLSMEMVPRISRAQSMDALSSMANISGYRAVIEAASEFGRFFTGQITAAGKVPPAKILVIGAGVAGLAAIGTATSLGAVVRAFDTRLEVAEQIHSLGGEFLKLDFTEDSSSGDGYAKVMSDEFIAAEMKLFAEQAKDVDIIITTAAIPGKPSPKLITKEMVDSMKPGSVIVDLAALGGGNCEYTVPGEKIITDSNVTVVGYTNFANRLSGQSSPLYSTNLVNLLKLLTPEKQGEVNLNFDDIILRNMSLSHDGNILYPPPPIQVSATPKPVSTVKSETTEKVEKAPVTTWKKILTLVVSLVFVLWLGNNAPEEFLGHFTVFVLACVVGYYVVWNVSHSLHTPLMSVTNAISGIIVVGALLQIGQGNGIVNFFSFIAILIASINIFGGFAVTRRMLSMFRKG